MQKKIQVYDPDIAGVGKYAVVHGTMMLVMSEAERMLPIAVHVKTTALRKSDKNDIMYSTSAPGLLMNDASQWNSHTFTVIHYIMYECTRTAHE